ncbi:MAG TPA: nuclear transport factor 2 family protein [Chitinophagaceae bacterium]|nr:nuclear transport factor 2 family protein [Chitinophagaceae bacterium]
MKALILGLFLLLGGVQWSSAQSKQDSTSTRNYTKEEQEIINLSKTKWQWMADKNVDKLAPLFHDKSKFVHMSGTWKKNEELEIIKTGSIWYKKTDVHDVAVEIVNDVAIAWSRITLTAEVRGNDAVTQFTVTEVYKKQGNDWKLLVLTFSSVRDTHQIKH